MIHSDAAQWLLEDHPEPTVMDFWRYVDTQQANNSMQAVYLSWIGERTNDCLAAMGNGHRCSGGAYGAPFCDRHLKRARDWFRMLDLRDEIRHTTGLTVSEAASVIRTARNIINQHRSDLVYFWEVDGAGVVKIGHSMQVATRTAQFLRGLGCTFPPDVDPSRGHLLGTTPGGHALERALHVKYRRLWVVGEWFRLDEELATEITSLISTPAERAA